MANPGAAAHDSTARALMSFLEFAIQKGQLKAATGQAMRTAVKEVLASAEGEDWEDCDVDSLDLHDALRRFETKRARDYAPGSLATYKSRFERSVQMFKDWRASPGTWRPDVKQRTRPARKSSQAEAPMALRDAESESQAYSSAPGLHDSASRGQATIKYPFPLRDGLLASIELPADLTRHEARRLSAFIESLAIDDPPEDERRTLALPSTAAQARSSE